MRHKKIARIYQCFIWNFCVPLHIPPTLIPFYVHICRERERERVCLLSLTTVKAPYPYVSYISSYVCLNLRMIYIHVHCTYLICMSSYVCILHCFQLCIFQFPIKGGIEGGKFYQGGGDKLDFKLKMTGFQHIFPENFCFLVPERRENFNFSPPPTIPPPGIFSRGGRGG